MAVTAVEDVPATYRVLADHFGDEKQIEGTPSLDDVQRFVASHVARLLDGNPGLLMSILYRIDVAESDVQAVLQHAPHDVIPDELARLIVSRQLEKLAARGRYRNEDES